MCVLFLAAKHHRDIMGTLSGALIATASHVYYVFRTRPRATAAVKDPLPPSIFTSSLEDFPPQEHIARPDPQSTTKSLTPETVAYKRPPTVNESPSSPIPEDILDRTPLNPQNFSDSVFDQLELLGKSSTRTLHKVGHTLTGAVYACKVITPRELQVDQIIGQLHPLRALKHPNIVECYGIFGGEYGEGDVKIVLEYHALGSLGSIASLIKQSGDEIEEVVAGKITEGVIIFLAHPHIYS